MFTVNHGPPRECHAPENQAFMQAIARGECPDELSATEVTDVSLMKMEANYEEPEKPKCVASRGNASALLHARTHACAMDDLRAAGRHAL